eukprot:TRINITY_DN18769_c1_g1_i2.p1 TRINITY_DN18769_c1_g1~~TRINITY_DN18769_c1_g1_i2.p1  ORF type:complete len:244 (-),score=34.24 TRINITY_DN18769_c1_g1_i2:242-973(-)
MRSPMSRSRSRSSAGRKTPERPDMSPISVYSDASTVRRTYSGMNPVKIAARAIGSCFAPPETTSSKFDRDLDVSKAPSVSSSASDSSKSRRSHRGIYSTSSNSSEVEPGGMKFTMGEINKATRNFSPSFKLGQGGFGTVYRGRLEDGKLVAIKRAKKTVYDKHLSVEFQSEIRTLARVEHLNLVRFYGYLEHGDERIVIVEYVPNGTLREHLDCEFLFTIFFIVVLGAAFITIYIIIKSWTFQ